ncbi:MAG: S9 family peptidase [Gammaproteobacteria bacterium]|nr:S9 family peptidase [Gammaproteobacteria bacterium]
MTDSTPLPEPPTAATRPHAKTYHGITVEDPYHWLKDQSYPEVDDPDVLAYLKAENSYFEAMMAPHADLVETLYQEIKARQQQDEAGVPVREGGWYYQWRYEEGGQYSIWSRWPADGPAARMGPTSEAATILDEPALAAGEDYFQLGALAVSHNGDLLAYSTDTSGSERYRLVVKDLTTGELLEDVIEDTIGSPAWSVDDSAFLYTVVDENWRPYQVRRHRLGEPADMDRVVYEEEDPGFFVGLSMSASKRFFIIHTADHVTSEVHLLPANNAEGKLTTVSPRRANHEYSVDHQGDRFIVRTNDRHKNTRLAAAPEDAFTEDAWVSLLEGGDDLYIRSFHAFAGFIAVEERIDGLDQVRLIDRQGRSAHVKFPESAYSAGLGENPEYETDRLRLRYTSMVTPHTVHDYHLGSGELEMRKMQQVPSGYDRSSYVTERSTATARDGAMVPVSIVRRRDTPVDGTAPLYLYGYGAYGHAIPPSFSTTRLSLLDRGFISAIAHIRGGDDLGYHWYEAGKLDRRTNTFNDFVDVARFLVRAGYTAAGRIAISGGSAGGELVGAAVNQAPELWGAVAAHVPFVDVLNTMLDTSLPLTPIEWPEWGNPIEDAAAFQFIRSYSPYDQLKPGAYPPMLVTAGLNDPRVTYWEPAKYVAKLRTLKTDSNPLLLKTNMGAGHGGKSGRFDALREVAEEYAFLLTALGMDE